MGFCRFLGVNHGSCSRGAGRQAQVMGRGRGMWDVIWGSVGFWRFLDFHVGIWQRGAAGAGQLNGRAVRDFLGLASGGVWLIPGFYLRGRGSWPFLWLRAQTLFITRACMHMHMHTCMQAHAACRAAEALAAARAAAVTDPSVNAMLPEIEAAAQVTACAHVYCTVCAACMDHRRLWYVRCYRCLHLFLDPHLCFGACKQPEVHGGVIYIDWQAQGPICSASTGP